jgi:hypothetical protein
MEVDIGGATPATNLQTGDVISFEYDTIYELHPRSICAQHRLARSYPFWMITACTTQPFARWYVWENGMNIMSDFPNDEIVRIYDYSWTMWNPDHMYKYYINPGWTGGNWASQV